jgi:hypothetical protein
LTISPISTFSKNENEPNLTQFLSLKPIHILSYLDCGDMSRRSKAQSCLRTPQRTQIHIAPSIGSLVSIIGWCRSSTVRLVAVAKNGQNYKTNPIEIIKLITQIQQLATISASKSTEKQTQFVSLKPIRNWVHGRGSESRQEREGCEGPHS